MLEGQFGALRFQDFKHISWDGAQVPVDSGEFLWAGYEAKYIRVRDFYRVEEKPTFTDTVRVNLTLGRDARVLYLRWPRGMPGDVESAEAFLAVLKLRQG